MLPRCARVACCGLPAFWVGLLCIGWQGDSVLDPVRLILDLAGAAIVWPAYRRSLLLRGTGAVRRVEWRPDGTFALDLAGGRKDSARLGPGCLVLGSCMWLDLRGRRRHVLFLTRRGVGARTYAALRRRLHCLRGADGPTAPGVALG